MFKSRSQKWLDKEFLGFKYWIICDYSLSADFKNNIIWNK